MTRLAVRALASLGAAVVVVAGVSLASPAMAATFSCGTSGDYTVDGSGHVTTSNACVGAVVIDASVVAIDDHAFNGPEHSNQISSVDIPGTVLSIGDQAFMSNPITSLTLHEGTTTIAPNAFGGMNDGIPTPVDITIPNSVTNMIGSAFGQSAIGIVTVGSGMTRVPLGNFYNNSGWGAYNFFLDPAITTIGETAFVGFRGPLLFVPEGITTIEGRAFENSRGVDLIVLPDSLTTMGDGVFGLASVTPQKVLYCGSSTSIQNYSGYPGGLTPVCERAVEFLPNGGTGTMAPQVVADATQASLTANSFENTGLYFNGWNTAADGSGNSYTDAEALTFTSNLILYAQWSDTDPSANSGSGGHGDAGLPDTGVVSSGWVWPSVSLALLGATLFLLTARRRARRPKHRA